MYVGLSAVIRSLQYGVLVCLNMTGVRCCKHVGGKTLVIAELIAGLSVSVRDVM